MYSGVRRETLDSADTVGRNVRTFSTRQSNTPDEAAKFTSEKKKSGRVLGKTKHLRQACYLKASYWHNVFQPTFRSILRTMSVVGCEEV